MAVAKALGARRVIAVDIQQDRLDFAKSYAATDIYLPVCHFFFPLHPLSTIRLSLTSPTLLYIESGGFIHQTTRMDSR